MSDFLADRLERYGVTVTGISPYGFGAPEMFWEIPDGWEDITVQVQGVPVEQSGAMLLREETPQFDFAQNIAVYTWVLDGRVPFEMIFTGLKEPVPAEAENATSISGIDTVDDQHAQARMQTRFTAGQREMFSSSVFTWYKLDGAGTQFAEPSVLIQRTIVAVDAQQDTPLPLFRDLPASVDELGK